MTKNSKNQLEKLIAELLNCLGENINRPGLRETPKRVAQTLTELTQGNQISVADIAKKSLLPAPSQELIILKATQFYSLCEHHFLPFFGNVDIAYVPHKNIVGLGTIGQIIDACSQKLQLQENLTEEIASVLHNALKPKALMIVIKARHFCIEMRGIKKQGNLTLTRSTHGTFVTDSILRQEVIKIFQD
jgi:GTP cyclohydrolase IA